MNNVTNPSDTDPSAVSETPSARLRTPRARWSIGRVGRVLVLALAAVIFAYPILSFVLTAFRRQVGIRMSGSDFLGLGGLSLRNAWDSWQTLLDFNSGIFPHWVYNSLIVSVGGALLALISAIPCGYAMARIRFRGRRLLRFLTLVLMVMPNTVLVIPLFLEVSKAGAINSLWPVAVIMGFYPFGVYLAYIHFANALPYELVEAARIDGLGEVGIFWRIAVPLSKQAVALVLFFSFVANWTNYFLPLVLLPTSDRATVSVGLQQLIGTSPILNPTTAAGLNVKIYMPQIALATLITMIPVLLVFFLAQKYLLRGQTVGAVKG